MLNTVPEIINKITQEHILKRIPAFRQREKTDIYVRDEKVSSRETGFTEDLQKYVAIKGESITVNSFPKAREFYKVRVSSIAKILSPGGMLASQRRGVGGNAVSLFRPICLNITKNYFILEPQLETNPNLPLKIAYGFAIFMAVIATLVLTIMSLLVETLLAGFVVAWLIILGMIFFMATRYRKFFAEYSYLLIYDINKNSTKLDKARKVIILEGNFQVGLRPDLRKLLIRQPELVHPRLLA